jgi:TonB family protein
MVLKKSLRVLFLCAASLPTYNAESLAAWLPARVLGAVYPREAKFARIEGTVRARCIIREDGSVAEVVILSGHPVLARSVKANLLRWTFRRADSDRKVLEEYVLTYNFRFEGSCDHHKGCKEEFWYEYPDRVTIVSELPNINPGTQKAAHK